MGVNEDLENLSPEEKRTRLARLLRKKTQPKLAPLSFAQERLWFLDQFQPGSPAYNMPLAVRLTGQLDVAALQHSLAKIVARHETLRTTFAVVDERLVQVVAPRLTVIPHLIDLHEFPPETRADQAQQLAAEEAKYPFDLEHGPFMRTILLRLDAADHLLLITLHHIVTDGWMGDLIQELAAFYRAFISSSIVKGSLPDLPLQYSDFARWQREWLQGEVREVQLAYWQQQLSAAPVASEDLWGEVCVKRSLEMLDAGEERAPCAIR